MIEPRKRQLEALRLCRRRRDRFRRVLAHLVFKDQSGAVSRPTVWSVVDSVAALIPYNEKKKGQLASDWVKEVQAVGEQSRRLRKRLEKLADLEWRYRDVLAGRFEEKALHESRAPTGFFRIREESQLQKGPLYTGLVALEQYCATFPARIPRPRGKSMTLDRLLRGNIRGALIAEATFLYHDHGRLSLTGTLEGPFYNFASDFYELVAGRPATEIRLLQYVRHAATVARELAGFFDDLVDLDHGRAPRNHPEMTDEQVKENITELESLLRAGPDARPHGSSKLRR